MQRHAAHVQRRVQRREAQATRRDVRGAATGDMTEAVA
jgi:hypothetical protein